MAGRYYILAETENEDATFMRKDGASFRFFEIFQLSQNVNFVTRACPEMFADNIVVAFTQEAALKKFGEKFPNLKKRSTKDFYEVELCL